MFRLNPFREPARTTLRFLRWIGPRPKSDRIWAALVIFLYAFQVGQKLTEATVIAAPISIAMTWLGGELAYFAFTELPDNVASRHQFLVAIGMFLAGIIGGFWLMQQAMS